MRQEASGDFMDEREEAQGIADPSAGLQKSAIIAFLRVALYTMAFKFQFVTFQTLFSQGTFTLEQGSQTQQHGDHKQCDFVHRGPVEQLQKKKKNTSVFYDHI